MRAQEFLVERWTAKTVKAYIDINKNNNITSKDFRVSEPFEGCIMLEFDQVPKLARAFFRMSEYYEGHIYQSKQPRHTDMAQFLDRFVDNSGNVEYFKFWDGYNITDRAFESWLKSVGPLAQAEKAVVSAIRKIRGSGSYSIIGVAKGSASTRDHELFHAMYYLQPDFKKQINNAMRSFRDQAAYASMSKVLRDKLDYRAHIDEEIAAYLCDGSDLSMVFGTNPKSQSQEFRRIYLENLAA